MENASRSESECKYCNQRQLHFYTVYTVRPMETCDLFVNEGDGCKHASECLVKINVSEMNVCINGRCLPLGFDVQDILNLCVAMFYSNRI